MHGVEETLKRWKRMVVEEAQREEVPAVALVS